MSLIVDTSKPTQLLQAIKKQIDDGKIQTWTYDKDGDFTHTPDQWSGQAWLRPKVQPAALTFGLIGPKDVVMSKLIYGVYHGRFIEMLLTHFDRDFTLAHATASPTEYDQIKTK